MKRHFKTYGNVYFFLGFWLAVFAVFTVIPILMAVGIGLTDFDLVRMPRFVGAANYLRLFLDDDVFVKALGNTLMYAVITGPAGYLLSFTVAWFINDLGRGLKNLLTFLFYSPTLAGSGYLMWSYFFSNDSHGLLNALLLKAGILNDPVMWLTDPDYNSYVVITVILWMSMGAGFLSFVAGFKQLNPSYFEAAAIDGLRNRWQELWYVTLPQMRPQLLIGAVLSVSGSFAVGAQNAALTGMPSTDYSTHTLVLHISDYGNLRLEMGYASAVATVLFAMMVGSWFLINRLLNAVAPSD